MKIQLNRLTNKSYHMLHLAALHNHPETIHFLLNSPTAKKLELNRSSIDGENCTMLHHAARRGSLESIRKILELESSLIYEVDVRSNTALHYAAMSGNRVFIQITHPASVNFFSSIAISTNFKACRILEENWHAI